MNASECGKIVQVNLLPDYEHDLSVKCHVTKLLNSLSLNVGMQFSSLQSNKEQRNTSNTNCQHFTTAL